MNPIYFRLGFADYLIKAVKKIKSYNFLQILHQISFTNGWLKAPNFRKLSKFSSKNDNKFPKYNFMSTFNNGLTEPYPNVNHKQLPC